ncbi:MAG: transposase [Planctomycetaceae bacterium]|nr:transposase [Planctomycetaceae bacterium]
MSQEENVCVITRVRKDEKLFDLPPQREKGQRGRPKLKGDKICMNLRASHKQGWQETKCQLYGKRAMKTYKTFVAVSEMTVYKTVRVVIIKEANGWIPLLSTNTSLSAQEIIEHYGVRFGIEEVFKDLKEVWCWVSRKFGS